MVYVSERTIQPRLVLPAPCIVVALYALLRRLITYWPCLVFIILM